MIYHVRWFLDVIAIHILAFEGYYKVVYFEGGFTEQDESLKKRMGDDSRRRL